MKAPNKALGFKGKNSMFGAYLAGMREFGDMTILEFLGYWNRSEKHGRRRHV